MYHHSGGSYPLLEPRDDCQASALQIEEGRTGAKWPAVSKQP